MLNLAKVGDGACVHVTGLSFRLALSDGVHYENQSAAREPGASLHVLPTPLAEFGLECNEANGASRCVGEFSQFAVCATSFVLVFR